MAISLQVWVDDGEWIHSLEAPAPSWPSIPPAGATIVMAGHGEDGISLKIAAVEWHTNGDVTVDLGLIVHATLAEDLLKRSDWKRRGEPQLRLLPYDEE
jgi:hypothetical protein